MRWNPVAAALLVAMNAAACFGETPEYSGDRPQSAQLFQGRLFSGQGWWTRFGEPVNSVALAQAETVPSGKAAPMPMHGDGSYVYSPGACDYSPPCVWNLWGGYFSNPCRCHNHHWLHKHCGCNACGTCDPCAVGCGTGHHCHLFHKLFHNGCGYNDCGCATSCSTAASCDCAAPSCAAPSCAAPSCSTAADCGCKPLCCKCRPCHLANAWHGFMAHWSCGCGCDSCSSPLGCGCTAPAAPTPATKSGEKQAAQSWPVPMPEEVGASPLRRLR